VPEGANALATIYSPERLKRPMKRANGSFVEISWDQALDEIADKLLDLKNVSGPRS